MSSNRVTLVSALLLVSATVSGAQSDPEAFIGGLHDRLAGPEVEVVALVFAYRQTSSSGSVSAGQARVVVGRDGRFRSEVFLEGSMGEITRRRGFDGEVAWTSSDFDGRRASRRETPETRRALDEQVGGMRTRWLAAVLGTLAPDDHATLVTSADAAALHVEGFGGVVGNLTLSVGEELVVEWRHERRVAGASPSTRVGMRLVFDDYASVGGLRLPNRIVETAGDTGFKQEWFLEDVRVDLPLPAAFFAEPPAPLSQ